MANIFDGFKKMSDEELKYLVASLETVTITNIASEMGQKAKRGSVKLANTIKGRLFNSKQFSEPDVIPLDKRIIARKAEIDNLSREQLNSMMKAILIKKIKTTGETIPDQASEDEISVIIISIAAKNYKKEISESLTPAEMADAIFDRYREKLLAQMQEQLKKQTEEQCEQTEQVIQNKIDNMSEKEQKELKEALGVDNLTGAAVRKMLITASGTTIVMSVLNASGFGVYIALTTIMHAVFTTTLGITLPFAAYTGATSFLAFITGPAGWFTLAGIEALMINHNKKMLIYELFSQVVWSSVKSYGQRFTPKKEDMPSWLTGIERNEAIADSAEYMKLLHENEKLKKEQIELKNNIFNNEETISKNSSTIRSLNKKIEIANERTEKGKIEKQELEQKYSNANLEFHKIKDKMESMHKEFKDLSEEEKSQYELVKSDAEKSKVELDKKEKEINELNQLIDDSSKEIDTKQASIVFLSNKVKYLESKVTSLNNKLTKTNQEVEKKTDSKKKELELRWTKVFRRFSFEPNVFRYVVKNFQCNEWVNIEVKLMEMYETKDPNALSGNRGKIHDGSNRFHKEFSTPSGFPGRIFYKISKNQSNGKTVIITDILKHNDPCYCK